MTLDVFKNIMVMIKVGVLMNKDISTASMVFSYQKILILAYFWSIDPPGMAFFSVAIDDRMT